jgi:uncharacterized protein (DUF305 family)
MNKYVRFGAMIVTSTVVITDPRVRELADGIIESQRREIDEMKALIEELENNR